MNGNGNGSGNFQNENEIIKKKCRKMWNDTDPFSELICSLLLECFNGKPFIENQRNEN